MVVIVNGVVIETNAIELEAQRQGQDADDAARRTLAVRELLLQRARELGLTRCGDGRQSVDSLIEKVLDLEVSTPAPTETECRRHYEMHPEKYTSGELVEARHILIAVTPGAQVALLRTQAETLLAEMQANPALFAERAREASNCPSAEHGGNLGQFGRGELVPEFDKAVFATAATGVLPLLVQTRYGFHIVLVERRLPGRKLDFEVVREAIASYLESRVQSQALIQYVRVLAGKAEIVGVDLNATATPLIQ